MVWNVDPVIFQIGGFGLRYYPLCFIIGFTVGYLYTEKRFLANGFTKEQVDSMLTHLILGTIIGARLGHCLFYEPEYYLSNPILILKVWQGGLASHGGIAGILTAIYLYLRKWKSMSFFWLVETMIPPIMFTLGMIRIGNFFNSEIIGKITDVPWAVIFERVDPNPRHPSQIYEAIGYFAIAAIMYFWCNKEAKKDG